MKRQTDPHKQPKKAQPPRHELPAPALEWAKNFRKRLRTLRGNRPTKEFADFAKMSQSAYTTAEKRSKGGLHPWYMINLADRLGISLDELVRGPGADKAPSRKVVKFRDRS